MTARLPGTGPVRDRLRGWLRDDCANATTQRPDRAVLGVGAVAGRGLNRPALEAPLKHGPLDCAGKAWILAGSGMIGVAWHSSLDTARPELPAARR